MAKNQLLFAVLLFIGFSGNAFAQSFQYLSQFNSTGVPSVLLFDVVPSTLTNNVTASLPESRPVPTYHPEYIASGVTTDITLNDSADVWITFVTEGAGYKNVLGFYTYNLNNPPTTAPTNANIKIVFPNVSFYNSGGGLHTGDKVRLGRFPANTGIGFVLLANGFTSSSTVTQGLWRLFSNPNFNPEASASLRNHIVLLNDVVNNKIIMGFEDIRRDYSNCDQDFNDAVFYVTANPMSAINRTGMTSATQSSLNPPVSSGNNGGLESNGTLAEKIAHRNFQKTSNPAAFEQQNSYLRINSSLKLYFPSLSADYTATDVTPSDLLAVTNASEIAATDYFKNGQRVASIFATLTENGNVYDHSKVICDRLNGAELLNVEPFTMNNNDFILYHFINEAGNYEYAISFSIANTGAENMVYARWATEQYPNKPKYENFQVWGESRALCEQLAQTLLDNVQMTKNLVYDTNAAAYIPATFVSKGHYEQGKLILQISNKATAENLKLGGLVRYAETEQQQNWSSTITTNGQIFVQTEVPTQYLYDAGLTLRTDSSAAEDILYLADGAWGLDYVPANCTINLHEITPQITTPANNSFAVERGLKLKASTSDYISAYKLLKVGGKPVDISSFKTLEFDVENTKGNIQISLTKKSIYNYNDQYKVNINLKDTMTHVAVSLESFRNSTNTPLDASDISSIVLTTEAGSQQETIDWNFSNFSFTTRKVVTIPQFTAKLLLTPNPASGYSVLNLKSENKQTIVVSITNALGQTVRTTEEAVEKGDNNIQLDINGFAKGVYMVTVLDTNGILTSSRLIIQ